MQTPIQILLQTTIPESPDDWDIRRFSRLAEHLASLVSGSGEPLCTVTARNREADRAGNDPVLSNLFHSDFDELWLFAVDVGEGLSVGDIDGINAFHGRGGGLLITRDHMDLGCSVCGLGSVGAAHHFHTKNPEPDVARRTIDDPYTSTILWPNYHSGRNGDSQQIRVVEPVHELLHNPAAPGGQIAYFPAHPHEGAVSVPADAPHARVIAEGKSLVTGRRFNLAIAFERTGRYGRGLAESTFHHFCDYNWDARLAAPSFVTETPGNTMQEPRATDDLKTYLHNLVLWLAPVESRQPEKAP